MSTNNKWQALSMWDRALLIREAVRNGITDIDSIRDLYNQNGEQVKLGTPYRTFESGSDYDYFNAAPENMPQEDDRHWGSRNPHTGQLLKSPNHPTYDLLLEGEKQAGYKIQKIGDREYSFPNEHRFDGNSSQLTEEELNGLQDHYWADPDFNSIEASKENSFWSYLSQYAYEGDEVDSLQGEKEYREKYGHQFSGKGNIIQRVLALYNPWSSESMTAKASSPVVGEGLFDVNTARKAVIENDKEARKDLEAANALALTGSLVGASIVPSIVAAGAGTGMAVPLLTSKPFKHKLASKTVSFIGSLIGGELINKAAEKQTGQTVGENIFNAVKPALPEKWQENPYINDYIGPIVGEFLNPAYPIGSRVIPNLGAKSIRGANMAAQEAKNAAKRTAEVIVRMGDEASIPGSVRKQLINKESLSYIFNPKASKSAYNLPFKYSGQNFASHAAPAHPNDIVDVYFGKSDKLTAYSPDSGTAVNIPVITTSRTDSRLPEGARRWLEKNGKDEVKLLLLGDLPLSPVEVRQIIRRLADNGGSPVSMGGTSGAIKGALGESYIDPGGFNRAARRNGNIVEVNDFDIWKFTAPEYEKKYFGPRMLLEDYSGPTKFHRWKKFMEDALQRRLKNLGLNFIDKQGTPIVTMWHSDFPYPENLTSTPMVDYDAIKAGTDYNPEAFSILKDILKSKKIISIKK